MFYSIAILSLAHIPLFVNADKVLARHAPLITPAPVALNARQLTTVTTCAASATACSDGNGCCDIGSPCTVDSQNRPICGGGCSGGPQCSGALEGLCCDIGYTCDYQALLCQANTLIISTGTIDIPATEDSATTTATATVISGSTETTIASSTSSTSSTPSTTATSTISSAEVESSSSTPALTVTSSTSTIGPILPALPSGSGTGVSPVANATAPSVAQPTAATFTGGASVAGTSFGMAEMVIGSTLAYILGSMG